MRLFRWPLATAVFCTTMMVGMVNKPYLPDPVVVSLPRDVGKITPIMRVVIITNDVKYGTFQPKCRIIGDMRDCR
jgi:hypothetical protein